MKDTEYGPITTLPYGVKLQATGVEDARWVQILFPNETLCYIQKVTLHLNLKYSIKPYFRNLAKSF